MDKNAFCDLGKHFYAWYKENLVQFEYSGNSVELESELERIVGLIDYTENKKNTLFKKQ